MFNVNSQVILEKEYYISETDAYMRNIAVDAIVGANSLLITKDLTKAASLAIGVTGFFMPKIEADITKGSYRAQEYYVELNDATYRTSIQIRNNKDVLISNTWSLTSNYSSEDFIQDYVVGYGYYIKRK